MNHNGMTELEVRIISADNSTQKRYTNFHNYTISFDMFCVDSAFSVQLTADIGDNFNTGDAIELRILNQRIFSGWIETITRYADKQSIGICINGRSKSAILLANAVLPDGGMWTKHENILLYDMISKLMQQIPAKYRPIISMDSAVASEKPLNIEIIPGESYWSVMTRIATARGAYFVCLSDGSIAIRKLHTLKTSSQFSICTGKGTNGMVKSKIVNDETHRYSKIFTISQDSDGSSNILICDGGAAFPRTVVINSNQDGKNLREFAELHRVNQIKESVCYEYTMAGHAQNGCIWNTGLYCSVDDRIFGIKGRFLISNIEFTLSRRDGAQTNVRLMGTAVGDF